MASKVRLAQSQITKQKTINTDYFTKATDSINVNRLRYTVVWSGGNTPDIDIQLQSPYGLPIGEDQMAARIDSHPLWATYDIATVNPNISGVSGSHTIDINFVPNRYARLKFAYNSGDAIVDVYVEGKGVS